MIQTNKLNLPKVFVTANDEFHEPQPNRYSVTELLLPTRVICLTRKYWDRIEEDVADTIPALFGTAVHHILEVRNPDNVLTEQKLELQIGKFTVVGKFDVLTDDSIEDYKTCSVSKVMKQDFEEYRLQGLAYAWMIFKITGKIIRKLRFYCLMKDWSKIKSANSSNYPASPIYVWEYDIYDSDFDFISDYIVNKLNDIENFNDKTCSEEEKWYTGTKYAVYKKVRDKKASYIADNEDDAHNYITNKCDGAGEIEVRKGENIRCMYYCSVSKFCKKGEI